MPDNINSWVLLRGLTREHRHWEEFPQKLQQAFPDSKIVTPDLPGNGDYADIKSPASIQAMLEFVRQDIAMLRAQGPVHVIALSMGAMVAVEWMSAYPDECAAAILINTSLKGISPFYHRLRPDVYHQIIFALFRQNIYAREKIILKLTSNLRLEDERLLSNWMAYAKNNPVTIMNTLRQLIAASSYRVPDTKPGIPMLLLHSKNDNLVNSQCSLALAQAWELPLETHNTAGHDLTLDDGDWVCDKINHWLAHV